MKELTIEQKAEAYDKAIERAKSKIKNDKNHVFYEDDIIEIFSKLKESENERIRKDIIATLHLYFGEPLDDEAKEMIDWVEKQSQTFTKKDVDDAYLKGISDAKNELEKQGKQKPVLDFKAKNWYVSKVDGKIHDMTYNPTDMVEPKFKVGDWIVKENIVYHIDKISGIYLTLSTLDGTALVYHINVLDNDKIHLWTIEDAKDGDVLHSIGFHNDCIFIFNGLDNDGYREVATGYCCIFVSADKIEFGIQGPDGIEIDTVKPATKIQRDLLFAKMKEAGYAFDFEKKELKKIK